MKEKHKKRLRTYTYIAILISFIVLWIFFREEAILYGLSCIFFFSLIFEKDKLWAWIPAFIISWVWVYLAREMYMGYSGFKYNIYGVSLFPILAWPTLLMLGYFVLFSAVKAKNQLFRWLKMCIVWAVGLIIIESVGYNLLGVHLSQGTQYAGWPILNCFHSPAWMQVSYFSVGFFFYGSIAYFEKRLRDKSVS
ncbi:hypothetical protein KAI78_10605 [bacterium]|nr:hypothetical protein [bacterium]